MGAKLGDAFLAQPQDVMDSVQRLRQLAQQTGSLKSSTEQKVITTTKKAVPVTQTVTAPVIPSNTVSTASPVITEPATTVISIEPANPDVVYIPNYNPTRFTELGQYCVSAGLSATTSRRTVY